MRLPYKQLYAIIALLFLIKTNVGVCEAQSLIFKSHPKYEVRAVWLTTIGGLDWPHNYAQSQKSIDTQKQELIDILDKLKSANINTVLLQTRVRGTVIYPSAIEPWDGCFSGVPGKSPGYDPLAFAVDECHKRGMEIHAWIVTVPVGKWNALGCRTLRNKYRNLILKEGSDGFINPDNPYAATYISSICEEITKLYDIDGIHLDYIRYPENRNLKISRNKARENITAIVRQIHYDVKRIKPWIKMSCSPIGKHNDLERFSSRGWNAYNKGCQDVYSWLRLGLMDQIYPMMYFRGNQFYPFAFDWKENAKGRTVVPGLGIYFLSPKEADWPIDEIERQMYALRAHQMGYSFFRNKFFCDNTKGIYSFTKETFNLYPALVPPMQWMGKEPPPAPTSLTVIKTGDYNEICWNDVPGMGKGSIFYNVYAGKTYPVDISDVRNLIAQRLKPNRLAIKQTDKFFYAVTSMDRYGNESKAIQQDHDICKAENANVYNIIPNDGNRMLLPEKEKTLDADLIIIKDIIGSVVATCLYKGKYADISKIDNGLYSIYSLNKKNISHRIGFLHIYRKASRQNFYLQIKNSIPNYG